MIGQFLIASGAILLLLLAWLTVQHMAKAYARRHPELGAYREEGGGCGSGQCSCSSARSCSRKND